MVIKVDDQFLQNYIIKFKNTEDHIKRLILFLSFIMSLKEGNVQNYENFENTSINRKIKDATDIEDILLSKFRINRLKNILILNKKENENIFFNLIIKFSNNIANNDLIEENKICKDLHNDIIGLWNKIIDENTSYPYLIINLDGLHFYIYSLIIFEGELHEEDASSVNFKLKLIMQYDIRNINDLNIFWTELIFGLIDELDITLEFFVKIFGKTSIIYNLVKEELSKALEIYKREERIEFNFIFNVWKSHLSLLDFGYEKLEEIFIIYTYIALITKLYIINYYLSDSSKYNILDNERILAILVGNEKSILNFDNFFREDLFTWILNDNVRVIRTYILEILRSAIKIFNFSLYNRDILRDLYEDLITRNEKHTLGEIFTPDWVTNFIVEDLLKNTPELSLLDPSCGVGTFLINAIELKKKYIKNKNSLSLLNHILRTVKGLDINPISILIAKANYLLVLKDLINQNTDIHIEIPIYQTDSIDYVIREKKSVEYKKTRENMENIKSKENERKYSIQKISILRSKIQLSIHGLMLDNDFNLSTALIKTINELSDKEITIILNYLYRKNEKFKRLENKIHRLEYKHSNLSREEDNKDCKDNLIILNLELEKIEDKNIIKGIKWPSLEKSIIYEMLRPIEFIYEKFDLIVGNPPWIVYNSIRDLEYQEYLKHQIKDIYGLTKSSELMTHMELATLFFVKSAELYLKESGIIVFLMPKSIYSAEQHQVFRTTAFKNVKLGFYKIYDLENVKTLFKIPTCVIFAKMSSETKFPIECLIFKENFKKIKKKDIELKKDMKTVFRELVIERRQLYLSNIGKRNFFSIEKSDFKQKSYYYNKFYQGASITPRVFWCVDIKNECKIRNNGRITFSTSKQALFNAKRQWTIKIEGEVESDFLYSTILGINLFPFTYTLTPVILPIKPIGDKYEIIEAKIAADEYPLLANWLQKVEKYWNELKKSSQKTSIYFWLNYNNKLTRQNPNYKFKILYITAATNLASCVVNIKDILGPYRGFIADTGTYYFETNNKMEAYYLTAILNAPTINKLIKQFQTPGKFGKRNIHKKVLELNIPRFQKENYLHIEISNIGIEASKKANKKIKDMLKSRINSIIKPQELGHLRNQVRIHLSNELERIDQLVSSIL